MSNATAATSATPKAKLGRKTKKALGRAKRKAKLKNHDAAKALFEGKSKRSNEKKAAFRKKKARKK